MQGCRQLQSAGRHVLGLSLRLLYCNVHSIAQECRQLWSYTWPENSDCAETPESAQDNAQECQRAPNSSCGMQAALKSRTTGTQANLAPKSARPPNAVDVQLTTVGQVIVDDQRHLCSRQDRQSGVLLQTNRSLAVPSPSLLASLLPVQAWHALRFTQGCCSCVDKGHSLAAAVQLRKGKRKARLQCPQQKVMTAFTAHLLHVQASGPDICRNEHSRLARPASRPPQSQKVLGCVRHCAGAAR